jgi:4-methylaminobutanoate oxidase (formaldehyde-forming)
VDLDHDFIGRVAVEAQKGAGPLTRRLVQVLVTDPEPLLFHAEPVLRDGKPVGYVRAASYGHTLGGAVGLAMVGTGGGVADAGGEPVTKEWIEGAEWEVEVAGKLWPARASLRPLYDPTNTKVKA